LRKICERLKDDVIWALTGSLGHALQGVPVEVHDVDIQTDREGAYEIERRFSEFVVRRVRFSSTDKSVRKGDKWKRREDIPLRM